MSSNAAPEEETTGPEVDPEECDHAGTRPGAKFCPSCGAPIPAAVEEADPGPAPGTALALRSSRLAGREEPEEPEPWWSRWLGWLRREEAAGWARSPIRIPTRLVLPIAIGLAVIIAAGAGLYFIQGTWFTPEEPARELGEALEAGDGPAVAALLGVDPESHPLLASGALDSGYEPVEDFEVVKVEHDVKTEIKPAGDGMSVRVVEDYTQRPDMEHARVTVSYRLGGEEHTKELDAVREEGGWFRPWSLNPALLETTIVPYASIDGSFQLAGIVTSELGTVPDGLYDAPVSLLALPGVYSVEAQGNVLYEGAEETVTVPLGAEEETAIASASLRPDAIEGVTAEVHSHIDECAQTGGAPAPECGFREDSGWLSLIRGNPQWEVHSYPVVEVSPSGDDTALPLEVVTETPGSATVTYETSAGAERTITAEIHANGYADVEGGQFEGDGFVFEPRACDLDQSFC